MKSDQTAEEGLSHRTKFLGKVRGALKRTKEDADGRRKKIFAPETKRAEAVLERIRNRGREERAALFRQLVSEAETINLSVVPVDDEASAAKAVADLVRRKKPEFSDHKSVVVWDHPLIDSLHLDKELEKDGIPVHITKLANSSANLSVEAPEDDSANPSGSKTEDQRREIRQKTVESFVGVTSADFCVAESATLVSKTRAGHPRTASLAPSIHVAVIDISRIVANLEELYALLKHDDSHKNESLTNCLTFITGPGKTADIEATLVFGAHGPREVHLFVIGASQISNFILETDMMIK